MNKRILLRLLVGFPKRCERHCETKERALLGTEQLEPRALLSATSSVESLVIDPSDRSGMPASLAMPTQETDYSASTLSEASVAPILWGEGLTDPGQPSAWERTGMPLGEFHSRLNFFKRDTIDPLLAPGNPNFWHAHDFFVNPSVNENATLESLMQAGESAAAPTNNLSVYWVPSLMNTTTGDFVTPLDSSIAYYAVQKPLEPSKIVDMPAGLSIIAGSAMPRERQPTAVMFWNYIGTSTQYDHIPQGDEWQDLPLQAVIMFPQFWDGKSLTGTNFKDHMAYDRGGDGGPSSHPYLLPELQLQVHYGHVPEDAALVLSSDSMTADEPDYAPGWSMHADFIHTPWPERDAEGNLYDGFARRVNDNLRWPTVAGTDGNAARPNPMGVQQPFTPAPIVLNPTLPGAPPENPIDQPPDGIPVMGPQSPIYRPPNTPLPQRPRLEPILPLPSSDGPDLLLAWPTPDVVMRTGVANGIHGTVSDAEGLSSLKISIQHDSGAYWRPDGSFGAHQWHDGNVVAPDGHWRLMFSPAAAGEYVVTVVATNMAGNRSVTATSFEVTGEPFVAPPMTSPVNEDPQPQPSDPPLNPEPSPNPEPEPEPLDPTDPSPELPGTPEPPPPSDSTQPLPGTQVASAITNAIADGRILASPTGGDAVPHRFDGGPLEPLTTSSFNQAVPSSDWWSSVVMPVFGNDFSAPLHAHPLTVQATSTGLLVGAPTEMTVAVTGATTAEYKTPHRFDLRLELLQQNTASQFAVEEYGDWSFTGKWLGGETQPTATLAQGSPVVWLDDVNFEQMVVVPTDANAEVEISSNYAFVTVAGRTSLVLGPEGSRLEVQPEGLVVRGITRGGLAVGLLPESDEETRLRFLETAGNRPETTQFSWDTVSDPFDIRVHYEFGAEESSEILLAAYPHLTRLAATPDSLGQPVGSSGYVSPRGELGLVSTTGFEIEVPARGVLPTLPAVLTGEQLNTLRAMVRNDPAAIDPAGTLNRYGDTYWAGKAMLKLSQLAQLAEITGQTEIRERILVALKNELNDWFTATGEAGDKHFAYNAEWDTLQGYPDSFGSAGDLNDHHFHYGYFIHAAALVGSFDAKWAMNQKQMVDLLVADVAGTDIAGTMLPRLRSFSPMAGHSWASGHGAFASGNNHESSSESMNFATAVMLWGEMTGDLGMTGLGQMLYSVEAEAISEYWFNRYGTVFPESFQYESLGMVWGDGGSHATWFSAKPEMIKGINFLPFHGGSLYLAEMARDPTALLAEIEQLGGGVIDDWPGIILQYEALVNPESAANRLALGGIGTEEGQTLAQTYFWTTVLSNIGTPTSVIRGDHPLSAVFQKEGVTTYVAHNAGDENLTVLFNDNTSIEVPAGETVTRQRLGSTDQLSNPMDGDQRADQPISEPTLPSTPSLSLVSSTNTVRLLVEETTGVAFVQESTNEPLIIRRADDYFNGDVPLVRGTATLVAAARDELGRIRVLDVSEWGAFAWILDENGLFQAEEGPADSSLSSKEALFQIDLDGDGVVGLPLNS